MHPPNTIASAVELAVVHARQMRRDPEPDLLNEGLDVVYEPRATTWLRFAEQPARRNRRERHCTFCLAGAVMAQLLRDGRAEGPGQIVAPTIITFGPNMFGETFVPAFHTIDMIRGGQWASAWNFMHGHRGEHDLDFHRHMTERLGDTPPLEGSFRNWKAFGTFLKDLAERVHPAISEVESTLLAQCA